MRLVATLLLSLVAPAFATAAVLEQIDVAGDTAPSIRLHVSSAVSAQAHTLGPEGRAPHRIYLDLPRTSVPRDLQKTTDGTGPLVRVRAAQFDDTTTRVVLDLAYAVAFTVEQTDGEIVVELHPSPPVPPSDRRASTAPGEPAPASAPPEPRKAVAPPATSPEVADRPAPTVTAAAPEVAAPPAAAPRTPEPPPPAVAIAPHAAEPAPPARLPAPPAPAVAAAAAVVEPTAVPPDAPHAAPPASPTSAADVPVRAVPAPPPAVVRSARTPLVVIDAGHGGRDPGAAGVGGILEKDVVLELAQLVASRMTARLAVDVLLTRSDDSFVPIERRLALPAEGATLFVSLHANACADPSARGLEVFYGGGSVRAASTHARTGPAALLGRCLDEALEARIGGVRGDARPGTFGVLVRNPVPSALVEIGYLTHPDEAARARDSRHLELLADALVDGVATFLGASAPPL